MRVLFLLIGLMYCSAIFSQKEKGFAYVQQYKDIAIKEMQRTGVPASITLAQGILESRFGESALSKKSNNHFGIKCKLDWNGEKVYHDDDASQECFRKYPSVEESYRDHSNFLKSRDHYSFLFKLDPTNYEAWAKGLKKAGYATESDYPEMLLKVIGDYDLNQYTLIALNKTNNSVIDTIYNNTTQTVLYKTNDVKKIKTTVVDDDADDVVSTTTKASPIAVAADYPDGVFSLNGTKVFHAKTGTSLLAIANNYNIALAKLLECNDMENVDVLEKDQLIFLEKKQKKGINDFHVVQAGETLLDIAQTEAVRLDMLVEYNSTNKKMQPLTGEKIYLKSKAPVPPKMSLARAASKPNLTTN